MFVGIVAACEREVFKTVQEVCKRCNYRTVRRASSAASPSKRVGLFQAEGRIPEEMVDGEKLWESS